MFNPRPLVDVSAAISSALLMNETQWVGLIVRPIDYSLKGAILHIDPGPGLMIEESHVIEMESCTNAMKSTSLTGDADEAGQNGSSLVVEEFQQFTLENGKLELPDWASNITSVLWFPVRAVDNKLAKGTSAGLHIYFIIYL